MDHLFLEVPATLRLLVKESAVEVCHVSSRLRWTSLASRLQSSSERAGRSTNDFFRIETSSQSTSHDVNVSPSPQLPLKLREDCPGDCECSKSRIACSCHFSVERRSRRCTRITTWAASCCVSSWRLTCRWSQPRSTVRGTTCSLSMSSWSGARRLHGQGHDASVVTVFVGADVCLVCRNYGQACASCARHCLC